ncbi:MAG: 1-deoxy-D-xylulose-5-phosphate synthase [Bacillota bacterium]|nr:1-deoxy-D-xylulose-5-phosphate synthase [Bacillota bacterium]
MNRYLLEHSFPQDLKNMSYDELELLSYEIRDFLIEEISKTGGHLSSNLGIVELTIALHKVFNTPEDKIIWDVGHQSYVHKILTGRAEKFPTLRQMGGMSGFPKSNESEFDVFDTGHSSTSVSLGLGLAAARDLSGEKHEIISVIGDGAMTGGAAFEALNNVDNLNTKLIVILNDNGMSISPNTGGFPKYLGRLRSSRKYLSMKAQIKKNVSKVPLIGDDIVAGIHYAKDTIKYAVIDGVMFEELGFRYFGPVDGHDIKELCETLELARTAEGPVFIHVMTQKGKGYSKAEANPNVFHGIGPFDMETGKVLSRPAAPSYSRIFGNKLIEMAGKDKKIVAVSAAMIEGTGLDQFISRFPERTFDVGIAEGHAVTFAAGLAKAGFRPFVAIYSTFLQRAYDQIIEDVCLQNLPVTLCIDRAGIVGADGETHHGIFDISYLRNIPNMTVLAPKDGSELEKMMEYALTLNGPCAIRYPRGAAAISQSQDDSFSPGKAQQLKNGSDTEIWAAGPMVQHALDAAEILSHRGISAGVVNIATLKPLDKDKLIEAGSKYPLIATIEDNLLSGGTGEEIAAALTGSNTRVLNFGWPQKFIEHGTCQELYHKYGMDPESIAERIVQEFEKKA